MMEQVGEMLKNIKVDPVPTCKKGPPFYCWNECEDVGNSRPEAWSESQLCEYCREEYYRNTICPALCGEDTEQHQENMALEG